MGGVETHRAQIQLAPTFEAGAPAPRHRPHRPGRFRKPPAQGVFGAAMDDPLGGDRLHPPQRPALRQEHRIARLARAQQAPEAGDAAAEDQQVGAQGAGFGSGKIHGPGRV